MRRPATIRCPHCGAAVPRLSAWQSMPAKGRPNYHCTECGEPAWIPMGTRIFAVLVSALILLVSLSWIFSLRELDTRHPAAMAILIFVLLCAAILASTWVTGAICARTAYLVRSNFESSRTRPRRRRG